MAEAEKSQQERQNELCARIVRSRAEVLCAMDCLMHHLNDEEAITGWLMNGVPDGLDWDVLKKSDEREEDYVDIAKGMSSDEFEEMVELFATIVDKECFNKSGDYIPAPFS